MADKPISVRPNRRIAVTCSTGMWCAIAVQGVILAGYVGTKVWDASGWKSKNDQAIKDADAHAARAKQAASVANASAVSAMREATLADSRTEELQKRLLDALHDIHADMEGLIKRQDEITNRKDK